MYFSTPETNHPLVGETHRRYHWRAGLCIIFHCGGTRKILSVLIHIDVDGVKSQAKGVLSMRKKERMFWARGLLFVFLCIEGPHRPRFLRALGMVTPPLVGCLVRWTCCCFKGSRNPHRCVCMENFRYSSLRERSYLFFVA